MAENDRSIPIIREYTLEHIARCLGDRGSGTQIVEWLQGWGVPDNLIEYPNTKWKMVFDILRHYAYATEKKDRDMLYTIIGEMLHPLMYNGDKKAAQAVVDDFNKFLEYDDVVATYSGDDKRYYVYKESDQQLDGEEISQILNEELLHQDHDELEFLQKPENRERISTLRKTYQLFMNIVEVFCDNPSRPSHELNDAYIKTKKLITDIVRDLHLYVSSVNGEQRIHTLDHYSIPFNNLFTAEREYTPEPLEIDLSGRVLSWNYIRPLMHATYGDIDELYRKVDGSDILSAPNVQQTLNELSLLLSKTKEENAKQQTLKQKARTPVPVVHKVEIVNELQVRNTDENTVVKSGKRLHLPKFNPTEWAKVTIRFLDERGIFITADKKQVQSDYEALGFADDKRSKPNSAWAFLLGLARSGGETSELPTPISDTVKQHKRQLADRLKTIFKNDTDPFYDPAETRTYKLKIALIPPPMSEAKQDLLGVGEYLKETMTEEPEGER